MEIRVAFSGESQLQQSSATQPTVHAGCFGISIISEHKYQMRIVIVILVNSMTTFLSNCVGGNRAVPVLLQRRYINVGFLPLTL